MTSHATLTIHRPLRKVRAITVKPAQEPVPLDELKLHSRITAPDDDALLSGFIQSAREWVEAYTQRDLITRTRTLKMDKFPARTDAIIELPGGKLQSVTSIAYTDTNGDPQTWTASEYVVNTDAEPGTVELAYNEDWPSVREWGLPITITYVSGYGDDPGDVPEVLRNAIKIIAAELYENSREESIVGTPIMSVPWGAKALASSKRINRVI